MKKVRYVAIMTVEFDIDEESEKELYPEGLNVNSLEQEMRSDIFDEIFQGELKSYKAEGYIIEDEKIIDSCKVNFE